MKYYIIKDKNRDGYLSKNICRINDDGNFEYYSFLENSSIGKWVYSEIVENRFKNKIDDSGEYEVYESSKNEIEEVIHEIDDAAYDTYHEHYAPELVDSKGRKHSEYIYQDYRSLDGYTADTGFEYNEIWNREDYDYYYDNEKDFLIKRNKETEKYYILDKDKTWIDLKKYDFDKLELIDDFERVMSLLCHFEYSVDGFDLSESIHKDEYIYYFNENNILVKKEKNKDNYYAYYPTFGLDSSNMSYCKYWHEEDQNINSLRIIENFDDVLNHIDEKFNKAVDDFSRLKSNINVDRSDYFDNIEIMLSEEYDYYLDNVNDILIKKSNESNECFIFDIGIVNNEYVKSWFNLEEYGEDSISNYDLNKFEKINIARVIYYCNNKLRHVEYN